jgi:hypothetical protein
LVLSWLFAILCGWRFKYFTFTNSEISEKHFLENYETHKHKAQFSIQMQRQYEMARKSRKENNDKRVKFIITSFGFLFLSILFLLGGLVWK